MPDLSTRIVGMLIHRPYVFAFLAAYVFIAVSRAGVLKVAVFTVLAWFVAFACEFSSTRTGFPFGLYHYIETTRDRELWIANVPFWDSLSFAFLCWLGFSMAVLLFSPILRRNGDTQVADTREIRTSKRVLVVGTFLMALIDVVIDPLTLRGDRWFLGRIYHYAHEGIYFGVPISNFLGWAFVGAVTIGIFQQIERVWPRRLGQLGTFHVRHGALLDPALYFGILIFNLSLTFWIGEPLLGTIGVLLYLPVACMFVIHLTDPHRRATIDQIAAHRRDYPDSPLARALRSAGETGPAPAGAPSASDHQ